MQLGLLGLIAERGGFADIAGIAEAFEYWSISKRGGHFGYIATPVDPAGNRDRLGLFDDRLPLTHGGRSDRCEYPPTQGHPTADATRPAHEIDTANEREEGCT